MNIRLGRRFWIAVTAVKTQINSLMREEIYYRERIARDSALIEQLQYDDYLEEYARENYHMQRRNEHVYIIEED